MHNKSLVDKLLKANAIINNNANRGNGDYVLVSSKVADILIDFKRNIRMEKIIRIFNEKI